MPFLLPRAVTAGRTGYAHLATLALILLVAAVFRVHGLQTWDDGQHQHPDERFLVQVSIGVSVPDSLGNYLNTQRSTLNPYVQGQQRYAYGQLPLTLTRLLAEWTGYTSYDTVEMPGRALSALADLLTIVFAWLLARRVFGIRVAHLTALLLALTVLHIQLAHYYAVDTFVATFAAAALFFGQRAWQRESLSDALLAGVMVGLATACKVSAVMLLPVLGLAFVWPRRRRPSAEQVLDGITAFGVALVAAFFAFRLAEPYAFAGPAIWNIRPNPQWWSDKAYWVELSSGTVDVPFMIQWAGTPAYTFVLQSIMQWGMGPALGAAGLLGMAACAWRLVRGHAREREAVLVLVWTLLNLVYFGGQFAKFMRYLLPAYFGLAMFAAYGLLLATDWLGRVRRFELDSLQRWLAPAVVTATAVWALAFSGIYDQFHSRIQASAWIYNNIPAGAALATEHWDDALPLRLSQADARYKNVELTLYDQETPAKRDKLEAALDQTDYIILASRRLADSIPRLPERYPMATTYYRLLQSGQLGFDRVARFQVEPSLGPFGIDDSHAQEDFTVYDHPLVEIWRKRPDYSSASVRDLLGAVPLDQVVNVRPIDGGKGALLQTPGEEQAQVNAGTWSSLFNREDVVNRLSALVWLLVAEALALSSLPLLWRWLPFLPDRGFGISKIVGLASVGYVGWFVASLKLAPFERPLLLLSWALLLAISFAAAWPRRAALRTWLVNERRLIGVEEAVFLACFGLFLFIRAANPDLWHPAFGGEKPMNFAYLNAVTKSEYFPPYDPWFAGGIINYYYFGFVLIAALIKLTSVLPEIAFNLAEPTLFGALCLGAFSVAFGLSLPARGRVGRATAYLAGAASVLLVGILGNLDAGLQVLDQLWRIGGERAAQSGGIARLAMGVLGVIQGARFPPLDFWRSTRFIGPEDAGPIHEFPYFTFLYGDLHAHQIALPITVAVLAIGLNVVRSLRADRGRVPWPSLVIGGVLVGMLRATNTWDFPPYAAIFGLCLVLGAAPGLLRLERRSMQTLVVCALVFGLVTQLSFWPYLQRYQLFYNGVDPVRARTALGQYLTIHGLFLFLGASLIAWYMVAALRRAQATRRERTLVAEPGYYGMLLPVGFGMNAFASLPGAVAAAGAVLGLGMWLAGYPTRGFLLFGIAAAGAACIAQWRRENRALQAALFGVALFATLIPEFVALQGDVGRMNTVFKFYLQAWVLLSIAAAVAMGWLVRRSLREPLLRQARPFWVAVLALLVLAAVSYPLFASEAKVGLRFAQLPLSLDGMSFMDYAQYRDQEQDLNLPGDAKALRWMQDNIQGTPVVLEGRSPVYRWGSRVSIYTGLPTLLGWDVHQGQQRAGFTSMLQERQRDVERAYASPNPQEALNVLRKYDVKWVVIGGLERAYYAPAGLAKFSQMPQLRLAYDADGVQIYGVQGVQP
jgi:YYY domain-containing protein